MKKLFITLSVLIITVTSFNVIIDHYRYNIHNWVIHYESSKANFQDQTLEVNGQKIAYLENLYVKGQETIIMLHGFGASKENWFRFSVPFAQKYQLLAIDLLGHGDNKQDFSQSYRIEDQVKLVHNFAELLNIKRFHLVGHSMGGEVASTYASIYPDQVISLVLISPAGIYDIPSEVDLLLKTGVNPLIASSAEGFDQLLAYVMEDGPYIPGAIVKVESEKAIRRSDLNKKIFNDLNNGSKENLKKSLKKIKAPVLIIWGDHDRAINVKNIDQYAGLIPKVSTLVLKNIGHMPMVEAPRVTAEAMLAFMPKRE